MAITKRLRAVTLKFYNDPYGRLCAWAIVIVIVAYFVGNL